MEIVNAGILSILLALADFIPVAGSILEISLNAWPRSLWPLYRMLAYSPVIHGLAILLIGYVLQRESSIEAAS